MKQRSLGTPDGKRSTFSLDEQAWAALDILAADEGMSSKAWGERALLQAAGEKNMTAALRAAIMEGILARSILQERAELAHDTSAIGMELSGQCGDEDFNDDLSAATVEFTFQGMGFELKSGLNENGQVCFWIRDNVRGGTHLIIPTPFTADQWQEASGT